MAFIRHFWQWVEPGRPLIDTWHLHAITEHLEAVSLGQIRKLLINVPPRFTKSLTVSVMWPAWEWTTRPGLRYLTSSYGSALAIRDAVKTRRLITSPEYRRLWGHRVRLTGDQNLKSRYENTATGYRIATSVGGEGTGEGGDRIVGDDLHKVDEAESDLVRTATTDWWTGTMSTRVNDPRTAAFVLVMQRVHEVDVAGVVLDQGGYEHLCLPMHYDPDRVSYTSLMTRSVTARDQRTVPGGLLAPERFDQVAVAEWEKRLGPYRAAGQLEQRPAPAEGGLFKRDWWGWYSPADLVAHPEHGESKARIELVSARITVDSAFKTGVANDPSVALTGARGRDGRLYLLDLWRDKVEYPDLITTLRAVYELARHRLPDLACPLVIEDKASGQSAIQTLRRPGWGPTGELPALPVIAHPVPSDSNKLARAENITNYVAGGLVMLPRGAGWTEQFVDECAMFPNGAHDDDVDALVMLCERLLRVVPVDRSAVLPDPFAREDDELAGLRGGPMREERQLRGVPRAGKVPGMGRW